MKEHTRQFETEIPVRTAGSQQEQIASSYLIAHLQQAGYQVLLEGVPVADLVRSTDVIALPPAGGGPRVVVAVAYDTPERGSPGGGELGAFLELARALAVAEPGHEVEFAALGAEHATHDGGLLGSRRLAKLLIEDDHRPEVFVLGPMSTGQGFEAAGDRRADLIELGASRGTPSPSARPFEEAGMRVTTLSGDPVAAASALLRLLTAPD